MGITAGLGVTVLGSGGIKANNKLNMRSRDENGHMETMKVQTKKQLILTCVAHSKIETLGKQEE